jgi:hypothetical protein
MHDAWIAGIMTSGRKSAIGMCDVIVLGFVCDEHGRLLEYGLEVLWCPWRGIGLRPIILVLVSKNSFLFRLYKGYV